MRISLIGAQFPDSLAFNIAYTLRSMGHDVQEVDEDRLVALSPLRHRFRRLHGFALLHPSMQHLRGRRVTKAVITQQPDFVLNTFSDWHPDCVTLARRDLGSSVPFVFLYPDPTANLGREYPLAAPYDAWFFKDRWAVQLYRSRLSINAHYLPEACNPAWHRPVELTESDLARYRCDLVTAGNLYYYRAQLLDDLRAYDFRIWGTNLPPWLTSPIRGYYRNEYVAQLEKSKAFRAARIVINSLSRNEVDATNARTFEAAGAGAFQLVDWRSALDDLFVPDVEIVTFRSREELRHKVEYYLRRPDERARIAAAACRRAHAEHTYAHRLAKIFRIVAEGKRPTESSPFAANSSGRTGDDS